MIGKVTVTSWSNKVHPATWEMLDKYPIAELREYAIGLGLVPERLKKAIIYQLLLSGKATICGGLGN